MTTTTHPGAAGDTTSIRQTLPDARETVAQQIAMSKSLHPRGAEGVASVAAYHSAAVLR